MIIMLSVFFIVVGLGMGGIALFEWLEREELIGEVAYAVAFGLVLCVLMLAKGA